MTGGHGRDMDLKAPRREETVTRHCVANRKRPPTTHFKWMFSILHIRSLSSSCKVDGKCHSFL